MRRRPRLVLLLPLLAVLHPSGASAQEPTPADRWIAGMLEGIKAAAVPCPGDLAPACERTFARCAATSSPFTALKLDWELISRRFELASMVADDESPWSLEGGVYSRSYEVRDDEVAIQFWEGRGLIRVCSEARLSDGLRREQRTPGVASIERRYFHPAGFGGVSKPVVIPGSRVEPAFSSAEIESGLEVLVVLEVTVDREGVVEDVRVLRCEPDRAALREAALSAVRLWRFEPALRDGEPVAVRYPIRLRFTTP